MTKDRLSSYLVSVEYQVKSPAEAGFAGREGLFFLNRLRGAALPSALYANRYGRIDVFPYMYGFLPILGLFAEVLLGLAAWSAYI